MGAIDRSPTLLVRDDPVPWRRVDSRENHALCVIFIKSLTENASESSISLSDPVEGLRPRFGMV